MAEPNVVAELYSFFRSERQKHSREPGVVWVTDLVSCSLKSRYSLEYPELELAELFNPVLIHGTLVHRGLEELLKLILEQKGVKVEVELEGSMEVDLSDLTPGSGKVLVKGRADVILTLPNGEKHGVEIKSMRGDAPLPLEHHVDQARVYNTLFNLSSTILVYITPERITQYVERERLPAGEIAKRILEQKAPRYPWECKYCPFSVLCPSKR
ncbi:MAG: hypothetical protein QXX83_03700 [Thermofilum sp.]